MSQDTNTPKSYTANALPKEILEGVDITQKKAVTINQDEFEQLRAKEASIDIPEIELPGFDTEPEPQEDEPAVAEETTESSEEVRRQQKSLLEYPYSAKGNWEPGADTISLPSMHEKETRTVINNIPNINLNDDDESRNWADVISSGLEFTTEAEIFVPTLEDEKADFRQSLDHQGTKLAAAQPKFKESENQKLSGERGLIRIMSALGLGTLFNTPLWHTGIWITFKAPTESEIIELNRQLVSDKIRFGRSTYSLAYSNLTAYTTDKLVRFALDHVYDTTLKSEDIGNGGLSDVIACQDIPTLLWGLVCTMYPRGFQYNRGCINDPIKCNHVIEEILNVSKLQWTNNAALTDWQKTHMSVRRGNSKSLADVKRYKEELTKIQNQRIALATTTDKELFLTLKTPTVNEHIDAGHRWVGEIVSLVERTLGTDANESERNNFIVRHGQASAMRQYVHWVDSLEVDSNVVEDKDTIEETISLLSADNTIRNSFIEKVVDYINQSSVSVIGIPAFNCPKCNLPQDLDTKLPRHENIIPLDVHQLFFALATARISRIVLR